MIYTGEFADINNKYKYQVTFETKSGSGNQEIQLSGEDPIIIKQNGDKLFDPIKTQSATVKIVSAEYLYPLYNAGYNVSVTIKRKSYNATDYTIVLFYGYVTPNIYNQTYQYVDEVEIECISDLAMLKYQDYTTIGTDKMIYSVADIIKRCLNNTRYTYLYMVTPDYYGFDRDAVGQTKCTQHDILKALYLDEVNFFDDNEEQTPWTRYEVLEEIMKYLDLSLVEYQYKLMAINYGQNWKTNTNVHNEVYDLRTLDTRKNDYTVKLYNITESSYFSSDNNISLDETYKKIKVKANTYPYDEVFNEILDPDNWTLHTLYGTDGELIGNNKDMPLLTWTFDNSTYNHAFYLYFKSKYMNTYLYSVSGTDLSPILNHEHEWLPVLINADNLQNSDRYKAGTALMKIAKYSTERYNVVSKLEWKPQIIFYTGINNFNIKNYTSSSNNRNNSDLMSDVSTYMEKNVSNTSIYATQYYLPPHPLLLLQSSSVLNISTDSYLVISGKLMVNDLEWENSVKDEWSGSGNFSNPIVYTLKDQVQDFGAAGSVIGFPLLRIQIRIGDPSSPEDHYILCRQVQGRSEKQPDGRTRTYTEVTYQWKTYSELSGISGRNPYEPYVDIPVGSDKWGFYKFYSITNTCDWRLGIEGGNGFALPLPESKHFAGNMMIYVVGPTQNLYSRYVSDIRNLPTTLKTYTIKKNPDNIWPLSGWSTGTSQITVNYEGTLPTCIIAQDLKFEIKEVIYHNYSDTVLKKADNKKTDHEYENVINIDSIIDAEELECKINTQDLEKCRSFSSMLYKYNNEWQYINTMTENAPVENSQDGTYRIQEDNIIQTYKSHYETPKVIFVCDLNDKLTVNPTDLFTCDGVKPGIHMIPNTQEMNLKMGNNKLQLIEI